jgi:hypothetical protein
MCCADSEHALSQKLNSKHAEYKTLVVGLVQAGLRPARSWCLAVKLAPSLLVNPTFIVPS